MKRGHKEGSGQGDIRGKKGMTVQKKKKLGVGGGWGQGRGVGKNRTL